VTEKKNFNNKQKSKTCVLGSDAQDKEFPEITAKQSKLSKNKSELNVKLEIQTSNHS